MKRLLVINQYFPPDVASTGQYAFNICEELAKSGIEVYVVTGQPSYTASSPEAPSYEVLSGIHIHRVSMGRNKGREKFKTRISGYFRFLLGAWFASQKLLKSRKFHYVLTFHNPPFVAVLGAYFAKKYKLRFIYIPYDIHPDILVATGWKLPLPLIWLWEKVNRYIFSRAERIVALCESMKNILVEEKKVPTEKVVVIPLWAKPEVSEVIKDLSTKEVSLQDNEFLFLYSGNMGTLHNLDPIIDAAKLVSDLPVKFLFIGDGIKKQGLISRVRKEKINNVSFLPYQPEDRYLQLLLSSHACFVVLDPRVEKLAFPSRAFTFLSAGKPIIAILSPETDLAKLIIRYDCGWIANSGKEIAELIHTLCRNPLQISEKGKKAKETYLNNFKKEIIIKQYLKLLI